MALKRKYHTYLKPEREAPGMGNISEAEKRARIYPQAENIIRKFGGPRELARILKAVSENPKDHITPATIYRWMYPRERGGQGGEIPLKSLQIVLRAARLAGVMLSTQDIYPHIK